MDFIYFLPEPLLKLIDSPGVTIVLAVLVVDAGPRADTVDTREVRGGLVAVLGEAGGDTKTAAVFRLFVFLCGQVLLVGFGGEGDNAVVFVEG